MNPIYINLNGQLYCSRLISFLLRENLLKLFLENVKKSNLVLGAEDPTPINFVWEAFYFEEATTNNNEDPLLFWADIAEQYDNFIGRS